MATSEASHGPWKMAQTLGSGGFGAVLLFKNQETGQFIAVKQCRQNGEMSDTNRKRWQQECEVILRLNHPNVVKGMQLPEELNYLVTGELPVLAMEYCLHGDLRKVLNRPENCCGLPEYQVRQIAHDTAAGVEYLHSLPMIHRDIKPENIVIGDNGNGTISYKLIDLGYAKNLANDSICTSFVGTMQYLAPELFNGRNQYTRTVDYWSLGVTIFECITGFRPFLGNSAPIQWLNVVSVKQREHIHVYRSENNTVEYSDKLPRPNQLTSLLQQYFEDWLRVMLHFDPKERGRNIISSTVQTEPKSRSYCFELLEKILDAKLIRVYNPMVDEILAAAVTSGRDNESPTKTVNSLRNRIKDTWHTSEQDQLLLTENGVVVIDGEMMKYTFKQNSAMLNKDVIDLFVFSKSWPQSMVKVKESKPLPRSLQMMLDNRHMDHVLEDQLDVCRYLIQYCVETEKQIERQKQSRLVASLSLIHQRSELSTTVTKLLSELGDVIARIDFFNQCAEVDCAGLERQQQTNGIFSKKMLESWTLARIKISNFTKLQEDVYRLRDQSDELHRQIQQLHHNVVNNDVNDSKLKDITQRSRRIYENLRGLSPGMRKTAAETSAIVHNIEECRLTSLHIVSEIDSSISRLMSCQKNVDSLQQKITVTLSSLKEAKNDIMECQRNRQKDVWKLLSTVSQQAKRDGTCSPMRGGDQRPLIPWGPDVQDDPYKELHDESIGYQNRLYHLVTSLSDDYRKHEETKSQLDWSFLNV